jgi:hypothetical protein
MMASPHGSFPPFPPSRPARARPVIPGAGTPAPRAVGSPGALPAPGVLAVGPRVRARQAAVLARPWRRVAGDDYFPPAGAAARSAGAFGLRQAFVSKVELGERRLDPVELARFATVSGKPLAWFLC